MTTYAQLIRRHLWILAITGSVCATVYVFLYGQEVASIIIGWFVSVFWTAILLLEGCAFAAERFRPDVTINRWTSYMSVVMMIFVLIVFILPSAVATSYVVNFPPNFEMTSYYIDGMFGGTYWTAATRSLAIVAMWAILILYGMGIRRMFSNTPIGQTTTSRWFSGFLLATLFIASLSIPSATTEILKTLGNLPRSIRFDPQWQLQVLPSIQSVTLALYLSIGVWSVARWVSTSNTIHTMSVFILAAVAWMAPFAYGFLQYGPGLRHFKAMEGVYMTATVCIPLLLWGFHKMLSGNMRARS